MAKSKVPTVNRTQIHITQEDIDKAKAGHNPLLAVLEREFASLWRLSPSGSMAWEIPLPMRSLVLGPDVRARLESFQQCGNMEPCSFIVDLYTP